MFIKIYALTVETKAFRYLITWQSRRFFSLHCSMSPFGPRKTALTVFFHLKCITGNGIITDVYMLSLENGFVCSELCRNVS